MSGLSRTPGKRVWVNSPPRVRIPPAPPNKPLKNAPKARFFRHVKKQKALITAFLCLLDHVFGVVVAVGCG
jgi:hypothetical protein